MRAAVLRNTGDEKLEIRDDVELGPVGPGQVKVAVHATGVCHSDVSAMNGTIPQPPPFVPGHEGAVLAAAGGTSRVAAAPADVVVGDAFGSRSVPWYPASHGCVRIKVRTADKLWNEVKIGSPIYIYGQNRSR